MESICDGSKMFSIDFCDTAGKNVINAEFFSITKNLYSLGLNN